MNPARTPHPDTNEESVSLIVISRLSLSSPPKIPKIRPRPVNPVSLLLTNTPSDPEYCFVSFFPPKFHLEFPPRSYRPRSKIPKEEEYKKKNHRVLRLGRLSYLCWVWQRWNSSHYTALWGFIPRPVSGLKVYGTPDCNGCPERSPFAPPAGPESPAASQFFDPRLDESAIECRTETRSLFAWDFFPPETLGVLGAGSLEYRGTPCRWRIRQGRSRTAGCRQVTYLLSEKNSRGGDGGGAVGPPDAYSLWPDPFFFLFCALPASPLADAARLPRFQAYPSSFFFVLFFFIFVFVVFDAFFVFLVFPVRPSVR